MEPHNFQPTPYPEMQVKEQDHQLHDIQPGGGVVIQLELLWGYVRRAYLKVFRRGFIAQMRLTRRGDRNACPFEVLDPRDTKFYRNQNGYFWLEKDDPFAYRERLPFVRAGLAELLVFSLLTFGWALAISLWLVTREATGALAAVGWTAVTALIVIGILIAWFFRNPRRRVPLDPHAIVSPADGKIVEIIDIPHDDFIGGPAVQIGIFLSIFNVHVNRAPLAGKVIALRYRPGKYLNALRPESARENEQLAVKMQGTHAPHRPVIVRQITGAIARRIVNWLKPGDLLGAGEVFGMIKLGSRTELVIPKESGLQITARLGEAVLAGESVLAKYSS